MKRTKNETRARILDAAVELLERKSSQFIQLRDIAEKAGVSASLLVQYFGSKEELVYEARLARLAEETAKLFESTSNTASLTDVLRMCLDYDLAFPAATKDLMSARWWWTKGDEARFRTAMAPRYDALRLALAGDLGLEREDELSAACALTDMVYNEVLRDACVEGGSVEPSLKRVKALLATALAAFRAEAHAA